VRIGLRVVLPLNFLFRDLESHCCCEQFVVLRDRRLREPTWDYQVIRSQSRKRARPPAGGSGSFAFGAERYTGPMLMHHRILLRAFLAMLLVAGLHFAALSFYFYWQWWWFDILMHFLGGVVVGLGAMWALMGFSFTQKIPLSDRRTLFLLLFSVAVVGIGWEIMELKFGLYGTSSYAADTSLDLVMDLTGALAAYWYASRLVSSSA